MDVVTASPNDELQEKVFMEDAAGFRDPKKLNQVGCLSKALYGLKQAPRE